VSRNRHAQTACLFVPYFADMRRTTSLLCWIVAAVSGGWAAAPTVQLFAERTSPQPVGTVIGITALVKDEGEPQKYFPLMRYRFSVAGEDSTFHIVRDFGRSSDFAWMPGLYEHEARIKVTVLNTKTKEMAEAELPFRITPRVSGPTPVAVHTSHPLVALFSFPACPEGSQFRVAFQRQGDAISRTTGLSPCRASKTSNIYVAGMRADSDYTLRAEVVTGDSVKPGRPVPFHTGLVDEAFGQFTVAVPPGEGASRGEPFVMFFSPFSRSHLASLATDTEGNLVWYLPSDRSATRMLPGGRFLVFGNGPQTTTISEVDLVGHTLRETDMPRIAEQIEMMTGIKSICKPNGQQCVSGFHHDSIGLPNGHIIAIGTMERVFPSGAQGSDDPVNIAATLLIDLDQDMQVKWVWNAFDHLDVKRKSKDDSHCRQPGGNMPCAPVFLTQTANDWLHGNAVSYTREDGNLTLSMPEQDWVIKIDYDHGKGSGKVLWKLGQDGDFKVESSDPKPWFSYQHDAAFEPPGSNMLVLLDNGHRRVEKEKDKDGKEKDKEPDSRGQVWKIDEKAKTATLIMNADLGVYAPAMGSAHRLSNGNYHFNTGAVVKDGNVRAKAIEVTPNGKIVYVLDAPGASIYRSNRVADLYTPPNR
jgi:arylsulfate sulfotransferase